MKDEEMRERKTFGELELLILLAVLRLGDRAYGVPIAAEIEAHCGRSIPLGSVYAVLERLETEGIVSSRLGEPTAERGGKSRRYFCVTEAGLRVLRQTRRTLTRMWASLPALQEEPA